MKLIFLIIFILFVLLSEPGKIICLETRDNVTKIPTSKLELEFRHSVYGGCITLFVQVSNNKLFIEKISSDNEASISYYTDQYFFRDGKFFAEIKEERSEILVNDGWKLKFGNEEIFTKYLTKIFICR
jgi:hypothetical protein